MMGREFRENRLRHLAAGLAFASQAIHLWVLTGQLVAAILPGVFFFLVAVGQGFLGARLLFGGGRWTARLGILLNLFIVFVWLLTRALSVPQIFEPIRPPVGGLGAAATVVEIALVLVLVALKRSIPRKNKGR